MVSRTSETRPLVVPGKPRHPFAHRFVTRYCRRTLLESVCRTCANHSARGHQASVHTKSPPPVAAIFQDGWLAAAGAGSARCFPRWPNTEAGSRPPGSQLPALGQVSQEHLRPAGEGKQPLVAVRLLIPHLKEPAAAGADRAFAQSQLMTCVVLNYPLAPKRLHRIHIEHHPAPSPSVPAPDHRAWDRSSPSHIPESMPPPRNAHRCRVLRIGTSNR